MTTGKTTDVTDGTWDGAVPKDGLAVVDFWAPGCPPCVAYEDVYADSAATNPGTPHLRVNVAGNPLLRERFEIMAIPTTMLLSDGECVAELPGALNARELAELLRLRED